jgi:hypothetical protein
VTNRRKITMNTKQELAQLAREIKQRMADGDIGPMSMDEVLMAVEMGENPLKLQAVLDSFPRPHNPGILEIYQRFCGGVQ